MNICEAMGMSISHFESILKMTQRELADILGVERSSIAKWESGSAYPRASQLPALAKALGCSIDELYSREEESA